MKTEAIILAYYNSKGELTDDIIKFLKVVKDDYVVALSYIGSISNLDTIDPSIVLLNYGDRGYDLNCYKKGLNHFLTNEKQISTFLFINNSIEITDVYKFKELLAYKTKLLRTYSFIGFTKNLEFKPHYQSFLFGLSLRDLKEDAISALRTYLKTNPELSRLDVIERFELETLSVLDRYGLKHSHVFQPSVCNIALGFVSYLVQLGFLDNFAPINKMNPFLINPSTFIKRKISVNYGFKKKKSSTIINKIIK